MSSQQDSITITARCLCKANVFTAEVLKTNLPLLAHACHCDSCRRTSGNLYTMDTPWPVSRPTVDISSLKTYHFGPTTDVNFCPTCSTPIFFSDPQKPDEALLVFTGTLENILERLVHLEHHIFVGDTKDGGASMWLRKVNDQDNKAKRYAERSDGEPLRYSWPELESMTGFNAWKDDTVPIRCKCEGVDFVWHKGNYEGKTKEELPWFIDPVTHKPLAGFCACDTCRLSCGIDVVNWSYGELKYISFPASAQDADKQFPTNTTDLKALVDAKDPSLGTLTYYASSPDVQRYFCSSCSACIFYAVDDRPDIVDIAIGVLHASDGARAEGFLSWALGPIGRIEDTEGGWRHRFLEKVVVEGEAWRVKRDYPKCWRRVAREMVE